jgi:hypothetical protein
MKFIKSGFTLIFLLIFNFSFAQKEPKEIHIKKSAESIKLDGILDEAAWNASEIAKDFYMVRPFDTSYAKGKTEAKITFDDKFLYVSAVVFQKKLDYTVSSYKRDFEGGTSDVFTINIDTFKDKLNGMQFAVSPLNVQRESLISLGEQSDNSWDNKWYSVVKNYEDYWVVEMAIPFTTLRYKVDPNSNSWRVNFGRNFMKGNEISTWSPVPRNFRPSSLAFTGLMIWDTPPPKPGANISLIPYLSTNFSKDFPRDEETLLSSETKNKSGFTAGLDAKIAITPSLNLDLTLNPDFSQVEVDQQQTNLSRFELFFPEKRQFFIENSDLFGTYGFPNTRPFFSRRIGITRNSVTGLAQQVPIIAGARLSGKLNDDWRIGLLNMQTQKVSFGENKYLPATNYSVATVQRKVFSRSSLGVVFVNKENLINGLSEIDKAGLNKYNRVGGLEFNYYSPDNKWQTESYYHQSFSPKNLKDAASMAQFVGFDATFLNVNLGILRVGKNYNAEMGYVPRKGIIEFYREVNLIFNPKNKIIAKKINTYGIGFEGSNTYALNGKLLDYEAPIGLFLSTPAGAELSSGIYLAYSYLQNSYDPTNASDNPNPDLSKNVKELPANTGYKYKTWYINFESAQRNKLYCESLFYTGQYFNGKTSVLESSLKYRLQPVGTLGLDFAYTNIKLPQPYNSVKYWLVGPKAELSFSKNVFFSTFFQYNTQTNNTNINSRLQWRYKPVSDVFLVYTDNYFAEEISKFQIRPWTPKNRAIILKFTYWFNV